MNKNETYFHPLRPQDEIAARILTDAFIKMYNVESNEDNFALSSDVVINPNPKCDRRARTITLSR